VHLHTERLGSGRPRLVLVHGFTQTGRSWSGIAGDLARDHEVVLVDAPGHGGSSPAGADLPSGAHLLGEAAGNAVYVGYSMGGRLCLQLALDEPERVVGLVLLGATAGIVDDRERAARRAADEALAAELERDGVDVYLERWLARPLFAGLSPDAVGVDDRRRNTVGGLAASRASGAPALRPTCGADSGGSTRPCSCWPASATRSSPASGGSWPRRSARKPGSKPWPMPATPPTWSGQ
jgi:2-succinyl-6-hydroxy-2,4-cyclohexadiene-1-carboxylate synthase